MAAQQGFIYETNAYNALKKYGISAGTGAAGASSDRPDLEIKLSSDIKSNNTQGCELKISPTAAGSLVMKYYNGAWLYGDYRNDAEKLLLYTLGESVKLLQNMNTSGAAGADWRGKVPYLQNDTNGKKILVGASDKLSAYKKDIEQFGGRNEVHIAIPAKSICDYYNTKKCDYINVGTHGFYLLNKADPLDLNSKLKIKIPDFADSATARIRVRCQSKGGGDYQFAMTLEFSKVDKSPYNIAPVASASSVSINVAVLENGNNKLLLEAFRK